jgi:hypothetical protein
VERGSYDETVKLFAGIQLVISYWKTLCVVGDALNNINITNTLMTPPAIYAARNLYD